MNHLNDDKIDVEQLVKIRDAYTNLVDYLKELLFKERILDSPSYAELSRKLGFRYNWIKEKKFTINHGHYPKKETFDDLYKRLSEKYMEQLNKSYRSIQSKFNTLYSLSFSIEVQSISDLNYNQKSIKREFFNNIKEILKTHFPNARIFDTDISRIFFIRARALKDSHLKGKYKFRKLELSTLFSFIFKMRTITTEEFTSNITDINSVDEEILQIIRTEVENFIEEFIFANPFDVKYIGDKFTSGTKHLKPEYDLTLSIWMELSKAKNEPILLKHVRRMLKYQTFGRLNRFGEHGKGNVYSWVGLMKMLKELIKFIPSSSYSRIFEEVWRYIELRCLYSALPRVYHPSWYTISTIKFHIIMLITRDLGLDILNLKPIKPESFKNIHKVDLFTYIRHHIYINDKMSLDVNRLVLVMRKYHNELEGKINLVLNLVRKRIELTFDCPHYYQKNIKDWRKKWEIYLERRIFLIQNGIVNFIDKYFTDDDGNNYIFERFFANVPKDDIEQEIRNIMTDWINKNRPAPILNAHIITKLFCGTPNLITSGFIQHKS